MCVKPRVLACRGPAPADVKLWHIKMRRYLLDLVYSESAATISDYAKRMCQISGPGYVLVELAECDLEASQRSAPVIELRYVLERKAPACLACTEDGHTRCHYWDDFDISRHFIIVAKLRTQRGSLTVHQRHPVI